MLEIEKPKIECVEHNSDWSYARFVMEPLEGIRNDSRQFPAARPLLSCLPGVAVTKIKIDGVLHEFSTIPGVREDVTNIVFEPEGAARSCYTNEPKTLILRRRPCAVKASDIRSIRMWN